MIPCCIKIGTWFHTRIVTENIVLNVPVETRWLIRNNVFSGGCELSQRKCVGLKGRNIQYENFGLTQISASCVARHHRPRKTMFDMIKRVKAARCR